ncbi:signal protein PDZ [Rothia kristinae]|uniref:endopeptidase La n=1 Tax=Rothia kristinae TaxID=37923 RepID=A0A7T4MTD8_9MICC|nr:S16 family serine protease [Rothia kristinae]QQC59288.1 signal protein PDZ [Rothia kristinae]
MPETPQQHDPDSAGQTGSAPRALTLRPRRTQRRRARLTGLCGAATVGILAAGALLAPPFVTEAAGPTFNTIGEWNGHQLIRIDGAETYPVSGSLDMTTVSVAGGPNSQTNPVAVLGAFLDPGRTALPADALYAPGTSSAQVAARNSADMTDSQSAAQAAAAEHLGIDYSVTLRVAGRAPQSAAGPLGEGDVLVAVGGTRLKTYQDLTDALQRTDGKAVDVVYRPGGEDQERTVRLTPRRDDASGRWVLGLYLKPDYHFPFTVDYGLQDVGGPSAGTMFALGIIDELTPGSLTGGKHVAGTGTIDAQGKVGAIGGIRQKMIGARQAGATLFLAPADNCDEITGHIPEGLSVVRVSTLDEAVEAVRGVGEGKDPASYPQCGS